MPPDDVPDRVGREDATVEACGAEEEPLNHRFQFPAKPQPKPFIGLVAFGAQLRQDPHFVVAPRFVKSIRSDRGARVRIGRREKRWPTPL
jgi:hypothetical protein